jgi:hypothetical protein
LLYEIDIISTQYIFIINLFKDANIDTIFYKSNQNWDWLTRRREYIRVEIWSFAKQIIRILLFHQNIIIGVFLSRWEWEHMVHLSLFSNQDECTYIIHTYLNCTNLVFSFYIKLFFITPAFIIGLEIYLMDAGQVYLNVTNIAS